jgi:hypothetical protein
LQSELILAEANALQDVLDDVQQLKEDYQWPIFSFIEFDSLMNQCKSRLTVIERAITHMRAASTQLGEVLALLSKELRR